MGAMDKEEVLRKMGAAGIPLNAELPPLDEEEMARIRQNLGIEQDGRG